MLRLEQFNGFAARIDSTILMLNDIWNGLVNDVKATKKCYKELEAAMTTTNNHLNNRISALDARVDKCEDKHRTLRNVMEDVRYKPTIRRATRRVGSVVGRVDPKVGFGPLVQKSGRWKMYWCRQTQSLNKRGER